jgi:signal transduction histidine kinase
MGKPLRVLIVEDVEQDAVLLLLELRRGDFDVTSERVETPEAMLAALARQSWDIVISDYSLPRFGAITALALVKEQKIDIPFIVVSGTVSEETAVEAMKAGAHDFMAKGRFARLIPAIDRELRDAALRVERLKLQEQLLISDRMASVGTLAAGVAHEINNPLAALMANLDFAAEEVTKLDQELRTKAGPGPGNDPAAGWLATRLGEIEEPLRDARESANRVRHIVRDLKIFSRSDDEKRGAIDIRRVLESSIRMAWNEIRHRAQLRKEFADVPAVEGNEGRLGQVFLNLIMNAAQALPEGRADKHEIRIVTRQHDAGNVAIEVHDTGSGIPPSVLPRIFDPFFTTKGVGVGTGLGLAICHRIITGLGGQITVDSQVGKGTVFRAILPVAKGETVEATPVSVVAVSGRRGRILVIDDEALLGQSIRRMLTAEHDVLAITSAREGIDRVSRGERFDVILCDVMMPEVSGMDLHAEIVRLAPHQADKIVFMTGGAFTQRARTFLDQARNPRLEKPFDINNLRALVHSLLREVLVPAA